MKNREGAKISRLPNPWRERFTAFSVEEGNFLYRDDRLVIHQNQRKSILSAVHYGHPGRDQNFGGPIFTVTLLTPQRCATNAKKQVRISKLWKKLSEFGKNCRKNKSGDSNQVCWTIPECGERKKYLLVSIDNVSAWPDAMFLAKPTTKKVIDILKKFTSRKTEYPNKSDRILDRCFMCWLFKKLCDKFGIKHVTCLTCS